MHPTYVADKPGDCPICNMKLVAMADPAPGSGDAALAGRKICILHKCKMPDCVMELPHPAGETVTCPVCGTKVFDAPADAQPLYYRHPMRPEVTSPAAQKDEMGMDYIPVYAEEKTSVPVEGQAAVVISEARRQMIGMKSEPVERRELAVVVRASGKVAYDPDLYNTLSEYKETVRAREKVKDSPYPDALERADALVRASTLRLRQMGLTDAQIAASAQAADPTNLLIGGGGGAVWVYAQIYEYEIGLVKAGQSAEIITPAYPGKVFRGTVRSVDSILSAETRSLKVRIEVPDPQGLFKLEMYVDAAIRSHLGRRLALPESALLDTGARQIVFVDLGQGRIEPREVIVGQKAEGYYDLLSGVSPGEKVVTSANFLIDSESKLKAALSGRGKRRPAQDGGPLPAAILGQEHDH
jgi:Cu(I)/Ag(I) efflux system membrane fusion protein